MNGGGAADVDNVPRLLPYERPLSSVGRYHERIKCVHMSMTRKGNI